MAQQSQDQTEVVTLLYITAIEATVYSHVLKSLLGLLASTRLIRSALQKYHNQSTLALRRSRSLCSLVSSALGCVRSRPCRILPILQSYTTRECGFDSARMCAMRVFRQLDVRFR